MRMICPLTFAKEFLATTSADFGLGELCSVRWAVFQDIRLLATALDGEVPMG